MNKIQKVLTSVLSYLLVAVVAASLTLLAVAPNGQNSQGTTKLDALQQLIVSHFIGEVDETALGDAAAEAMIEAMGDRWSYYVSAKDFAAFMEQKDNSYVGIGVTVDSVQVEQGLLVMEVAPGGGAEESGILAGDLIIGVDGTDIRGMDVDASGDLIQGDVNTTVSLTIQRGEQELTFTVTRRQIKTIVASGKLLDNGVGYIIIDNFNTGCSKETIAAIESLREQGAKYLVFDVRNNGGGYAHEMNAVLDYLLPEGDLFRTEDYAGNTSVETSDASCIEMPMAVLVNGNSYSAAEFFAAALREYEWATVVGEQTSGKGYYQVTYQLSDGSAVALSVGKYYTPKGVSLAGVGITPDIPVSVDDKTAAAIYAGTIAPEDDPQLQAAIQALLDNE